jgi:hypothetical protein
MRASSPARQLPLRWALPLACFILLMPTLACALGSGSTARKVTHFKFLVLLCQASDVTGDPPQKPAYYQKLFLDKTPGFQNVYNYFIDESYGAADIEGTVVKDWLPTTFVSKASSTTDPSKVLPTSDRVGLTQDCADAFKASGRLTEGFTDFASGGIISIWNFDTKDGLDDGASAVGSSGIVEEGKNYGGVNGRYYRTVSFFTHEMLHIMGIDHARGPYPDYPEEHLVSQEADLGSTHAFGKALFEEYGDCWTIMGCGEWTINQRGPLGEGGPALGAAQRDFFGWIPGSRVLLWDMGKTTKVTLAPANKPEVAGTLLIKIPLSPSVLGGACCGFYTVEYIEKSGWNANIALDHAVLIHEIRPGDPVHTYMVSRSVYGAWLPGQVFLDSASHVRISVESYGDAATITLSGTGAGDDGSAKCDPPGRLEGSGVMSAPEVKVDAPLDNAHSVAGTPVTLQVTADDPTISAHPPVADKVPEDRISWTANGSPIGTGSSLTHTFASSGDYTIQVVAHDSYCIKTTRAVTLHVDPPTTAPTVTILQPVNGQTYLVGPPSFSQTIAFVGAGSSSIVSFDWVDSGPAGYLGSGDHTSASIPLTSTSHNCVIEPHTITLRGKTSTGAIAIATVTITLKTDCIR